MKKIITAILLCLMLISTPVAGTANSQTAVLTEKAAEWEYIGKQLITCYCPVCNDGQGHESSSGRELRYGYAACSWLPEGTKISIEGEIFEIVDICGTGAIDIFIDTDDTVCRCNLKEYRRVSIYKGKRNEKD